MTTVIRNILIVLIFFLLQKQANGQTHFVDSIKFSTEPILDCSSFDIYVYHRHYSHVFYAAPPTITPYSFGPNTFGIDIFRCYRYYPHAHNEIDTLSLAPISIGTYSIYTILFGAFPLPGDTFCGHAFSGVVADTTVFQVYGCSVGINQSSVDDEFNFYVNENNMLNISFLKNNTYNNLQVELYDSKGQLVLMEKINNKSISISLSTLNSGIYFTILKSQNEIRYSKKILLIN